VNAALRRLSVEPIRVRSEQVRRHGMRARQAHVDVARSHVVRTLPDIAGIVTDAGLPPAAERFALAVFARLAEAEAAVHGVAVTEIHFHEVGALDSIADVVGCAVALHDLRVLADGGGTRVVVSPVAVGSGATVAEHGLLPVPPPATLELLTGVPLAAHPARRELCTPTGAALLVTLADEWGPLPACTPTRIGVGAGSLDPDTHPNVIRLVFGADDPRTPPPPGTEELVLVESTVDDLDPRLWPDVLATLRAVGSLDAWYSPVTTRDGRPGHCLSVLSTPERLDAVCHSVFVHTSALGLRVQRVQRRSLPRDQVTVTLRGYDVDVKRGWLDGKVVTLQPEFQDARKVAQVLGLPVRQVLAEAGGAASTAARTPQPDP
jgi:uncharacterized protein (TIGR00299 family) protein